MTTLIAIMAIGLPAAGAIAAILGGVSVAIHREEKNLTLTSEPTDTLTQVARRLNGVYVRAAAPDRQAARRVSNDHAPR